MVLVLLWLCNMETSKEIRTPSCTFWNSASPSVPVPLSTLLGDVVLTTFVVVFGRASSGDYQGRQGAAREQEEEINKIVLNKKFLSFPNINRDLLT